MVVLRAIGRFFARIGRWIRDTAWVQPLLIVGGIFAIIFSIPGITKWVQSWFKSGDAAISFYKKSLSYKKLTNGDDDGVGSDGEALLSFVLDDSKAENDARFTKYGDKFFVLFVQEECDVCAEVYDGWKSAKTNWAKNKEFTTYADGTNAKSSDFKVYTIFVDALNDDDENYFLKLYAKLYMEQFGLLSTLQTPYNPNASKFEYLADVGDPQTGESNFTTPTAFLFDYSFAKKVDADDSLGYRIDGGKVASLGVTEIMTEIPDKSGAGSEGTSIAKARTIWDCWNHQGIFDNTEKD
ncbi:MAG: hypothetical protein K6C32_04565 [Bacilli bacterium]|nr:hypothetical protein [Bacilli bacterium]